MTKKELFQKISKESKIKQDIIAKIFSTYAKVTMDTLRRGDIVPLAEMGKFNLRHRRARQQNNPRTNQKMYIEAKNLPVFKSSKQFRNCIY